MSKGAGGGKNITISGGGDRMGMYSGSWTRAYDKSYGDYVYKRTGSPNSMYLTPEQIKRLKKAGYQIK
jgi:hypothetical protein